MGRKWHIRIGTRTTSRKKSAIQAAIEGRMLDRHYKYVQTKYQRALYNWLRDHLPPSFSNHNIQDFAESAINDAFVNIKEFDRLRKAKPDYKFRTFLRNTVFKATREEYRGRKDEFVSIDEILQAEPFARGFDLGISNALSEEFVREAILTLKKEDEVKYEVFYRRFREEMPYARIYEELKDQYPSTITSEKACRQVYSRTIPKLKKIFRALYKNEKYVDKDLPFNRYILKRLRAETTRKK